MTIEYYKRKFRPKATKVEYSEEEIQERLAYAAPLLLKDLPIIYNTSNLSALVGYNKTYKKKVALRTRSFYRTFFIKKRNGQLRKLQEPLPSLKEIYDWILVNVFTKYQLVSMRKHMF